MAQYIDKSALVAEIDRRLSLLENGTGDSEVMKRVEGVIKGYKSILSFIYTLEMKGVALEKEIDDAFLENKCNITDNVSLAEFVRIARHFFELGLKAQKGE